MKVLFSLASVAAFGVSIIGQESARYAGPIIDMHQHAEWDMWSSTRPCFPAPCTPAPTKIQSLAELKPRTMKAMEEHNIVMAVVSAPPRYVLPWTEGEDDRLLTGIQLNNPADVPMDELRQLFVSGRAQVMGELAFQYEAIPIDHPSVDPILAMAESLDVPVHVHVLGLGGEPGFPIELGNPTRVATVMRRHPNLRIYLENAGWPFLEEVTSLMYQYPGVYADISTIAHLFPRDVFHAYLRGLVENGLGKRLMFGSDQMLWPEVIGEVVDAINSAEFLSLEQKADIFYNNAARFLRLDPAEIARHHKG